MTQDTTNVLPEEEDNIRFQPMLPELSKDSSAQSRLSHAIANRDPEAVRQVLAEKPALNDKFLGNRWSERVIASFHPEVARLMKEAGTRFSLPRPLVHIACRNDDVAAFEWLLNDPKVKKTLSRPNKRNWMPGTTELEAMWFTPWRFTVHTPKMRRHLLEHEAVRPMLTSVAGYSFFSFKDAFAANDWSEVARLMRVLGAVPAPPPRNNQVSQNRPPLVDLLLATASHSTEVGFFFLEEKLRDFPEAQPALDMFRPIDIGPTYDVAVWLCEQKHPGFPNRYGKTQARNLTHAMFLSSPPALLDIMRTPEGMAQLVDVMKDPTDGQYLLANMAHHFKTQDLPEAFDLMLPHLSDWRDPRGRPIAHTLLSAKPSTGFAQHLSRRHPSVLIHRVPGLGDCLDQLVDTEYNKRPRAPIVARIRRDILKGQAKSARSEIKSTSSPAKPRMM